MRPGGGGGAWKRVFSDNSKKQAGMELCQAQLKQEIPVFPDTDNALLLPICCLPLTNPTKMKFSTNKKDIKVVFDCSIIDVIFQLLKIRGYSTFANC